MTNTLTSENLLFQSEQHPLVALEFDNPERYLLSLIHRKAYDRAAGIANNLRVLDLGCNNGYGTASLAERAKQVIGVDVSPVAIETARSEHAAQNIEYQLVDGERLPFDDASFDLVTSFQVIEHVDDVLAYLNEILRVLREGGTAIFTTPNRCIRLRQNQRPWNPFHIREYEPSRLQNDLQQEFSEVKVEGLFAAPELEKMERARVARSRQAGRLGLAAVHFLRSLKNGIWAPRPMSEDKRQELTAFMQKWSLADLYYADDHLESALDLMAVCKR